MLSSTLHYLRIFSSKDKDLINSLKNLLGFYPSNISLYKLAFSHRSVAISNKNGISTSNERLEYLGDAVLGAIVAEYLFKKFPLKDEGFLTKMRSRIVNRKQMNKLSLKLGINNHLNYNINNKQLGGSINGDAMEALIGAIYMDKGYKTTADFIVNRLLKIHIDLDEIENTDTDYKSKIIEWGQKNKQKVQFEIAEVVGEPHEKVYTINLMIEGEVMGMGKSYSKKVTN